MFDRERKAECDCFSSCIFIFAVNCIKKGEICFFFTYNGVKVRFLNRI